MFDKRSAKQSWEDLNTGHFDSRSKRDAWSYAEFFSVMKQFAVNGEFPGVTADRIDLSPISPVLSRLKTLTHRPNEHGRVAWVDLIESSLKFGNTQVGDNNSVKIEVISSSVKKPVLLFHTHPKGSGTERELEHLSPGDFVSLLENNLLLGSVVATSRNTLMVLRTSASGFTGSIDLKERLEECYDDAKKASFRAGDVARIATKMICVEFGLSMFLIQSEAEDTVARKVQLTR